MPIGQFVKN